MIGTIIMDPAVAPLVIVSITFDFRLWGIACRLIMSTSRARLESADGCSNVAGEFSKASVLSSGVRSRCRLYDIDIDFFPKRWMNDYSPSPSCSAVFSIGISIILAFANNLTTSDIRLQSFVSSGSRILAGFSFLFCFLFSNDFDLQ
ncbi:hypothetical protein GGR50DRAFT_651911 [Xylaria sp. CBS 124048]|nr:hypothetical protein GGR50DRAFT_651911 [Xylaria sp. CBS 124048]